MKTSLEKTGSLGRKLTIEVPVEKVSSAFDRVYKGIQKNANVKGFRKGKVPMTMIKTMYGDNVKRDVLDDLIAEAYQHAVNEHSLRPISQPNVNFDKLEESEVFKFSAEFEIRPEIELKKIEGLKVEKEKLDISEEKINSVLDQIRSSRATFVPLFEERPALKGDIAEIDFAGVVNGAPLEGGTANGYKLDLGSNNFIPGFEDGVIGMSIGGHKELSLKFPDDYGQAELAGQAVKFAVTLKALLKKELPAMNDEFVKGLGGPVSNLADLKKTIETDISGEDLKRIQEDLKNRLLKALVAANPVEIPASLKTDQKNAIIADTEKRLTEQGMPETERVEYKAKWDKDFDEMAEFMIHSSLLIDTIAEKNKLGANKADIDEKLQRWAVQTGMELAKLQQYYLGDRDHLQRLSYQITEEKVVSLLLSKADVTEVSRDKLKP